nr:transcriptional regulator [Bacillus subtilis]
MRKITERQLEALKAIEKHIKDKGFPPSYRELMKELSLKSTSSVKVAFGCIKKKRICNVGRRITKNLESC